MAVSFLDFEQPIAELEAKIEELGHVTVRCQGQHRRGDLQAARQEPRADPIDLLEPDALADHAARAPSRSGPTRSITSARIFTDFHELHGDRMYADDTGDRRRPGASGGRPVMVIGHQKGRDTKERVRRNYGMPKPEGYRKALRLMKLAERFGCR
jgi:acetyl-CoA carboxylase carboxyl transferase subunit alpha